MPRRPILSLGLLLSAAWAFRCGLDRAGFATLENAAFTAPAAASAEMLWAAKVALCADAGAALNVSPWAPLSVAFSVAAAAIASLVRPLLGDVAKRLVAQRAGRMPWDARRIWAALNVINHAIYAALFVTRSVFYTEVGSSDRPFYYESFFLGWLCGPSALLPTLFGWDSHQYNQPTVLKWMTAVNAPTSTAYPGWIMCFVSDPTFMYFYQIAEGTFHFMIVVGGLSAFSSAGWPPKEGGALLRIFRWGTWLEIVVMDVAYVIAYTYLPLLSVPGHWGLTTIMMLIHHANVLPDLACAAHEWKAARAAQALPAPE